MRNTEVMLELLREMADSVDGRVMAPLTMGASEERRSRHHYVEILADADCAEWVGNSVARITNTGYDLLNAIAQDETNSDKLDRWLARGMRLTDAVSRIVDLVSKAAG